VKTGLARVPALAAGVARLLHTPLPVILGWPLGDLYFWHEEACEIAGL
jgi:hypothetical protein